MGLIPLIAGVFQANADVAGAKAFPPEGIVVATGFVLASAVLFAGAILNDRKLPERSRKD